MRNIVRKTIKEARQHITKEERKRVQSISEKEIEQGIALDKDSAGELTEEWFQKATWVKPEKKVISLRVDNDVLDFFKKGGKGYQTRINKVLRIFMEAHHGK